MFPLMPFGAESADILDLKRMYISVKYLKGIELLPQTEIYFGFNFDPKTEIYLGLILIQKLKYI